jgi:translation elongation factor P/translation initiation factor 5A
MYSTAEFRRGLRIEIDGKIYAIVENQHVKPGKGGAFVRTKLKNLETGQVVEQTFRSGAKVENPTLKKNTCNTSIKRANNTCSWITPPMTRYTWPPIIWATP